MIIFIVIIILLPNENTSDVLLKKAIEIFKPKTALMYNCINVKIVWNFSC